MALQAIGGEQPGGDDGEIGRRVADERGQQQRQQHGDDADERHGEQRLAQRKAATRPDSAVSTSTGARNASGRDSPCAISAETGTAKASRRRRASVSARAAFS